MKHKVLGKTEVDLDKIRYDLALTYAKEKFSYALSESLIEIDTESSAVTACHELDYLKNEFAFAISILSNETDDSLITLLDPTFK